MLDRMLLCSIVYLTQLVSKCIRAFHMQLCVQKAWAAFCKCYCCCLLLSAAADACCFLLLPLLLAAISFQHILVNSPWPSIGTRLVPPVFMMHHMSRRTVTQHVSVLQTLNVPLL